MAIESSGHSTEEFYDSLFEDYHLIYTNWDDSIKRQAEALKGIIDLYAESQVESIWDCTCGIGTQSLGLADKGYQILGTDLSTQSIERAQNEADKRKLTASFAVADLRNERQIPTGKFDAVISCDNSLPHLLKTEDLLLAFRNIKSRLKENGLFIGSIRDYDLLSQQKPHSTSPTTKKLGEEEIISFQTWQWESASIYHVKHFILRGRQDQFETKVRYATYRAYQRKEIASILAQVGFGKIEWLFPKESGYYQPIFVVQNRAL